MIIFFFFFSCALHKCHPLCLSKRSGSSFMSIFALSAPSLASLLCWLFDEHLLCVGEDAHDRDVGKAERRSRRWRSLRRAVTLPGELCTFQPGWGSSACTLYAGD